MDRNSWDADGRQRLGSYARADSAYYLTLFSGWVGWVATLGSIAALAALLVWLFL
jgi:hypothetical protein